MARPDMTPFQLGGSLDSSVFGVPVIILVAVAALLALSAGVFVRAAIDARRGSAPAPRRSGRDRVERGRTDERGDREPVTDAPAPGEDPNGDAVGPALPEPLRTAVTRCERGEYDGAIEAAYRFARRRLAEELDVPVEGTHWDFYRRCTAAGLTEGEDALRELTRAYERATFGMHSWTRAEAEDAVALAAELTDVPPPTAVGRPGGE